MTHKSVLLRDFSKARFWLVVLRNSYDFVTWKNNLDDSFGKTEHNGSVSVYPCVIHTTYIVDDSFMGYKHRVVDLEEISTMIGGLKEIVENYEK